MNIKMITAMLCVFLIVGACEDGTSGNADGDNDYSTENTDLNPPGDLVINEIVAKSSTEADWVELYNQSAKDMDISNYQLMDSKDTEAYVIPAGTIISGGEYLVFERDKTGENSFAFGLSSEDAVRLIDDDGEVVDSTNWVDGEAPEDKSWGRSPDGTGGFKTLLAPSKGSENQDNCGDGYIDAGEQCDTDNLNGTSCESMGFDSGVLRCNSNCALDFSQCVYSSNEVTINEVVVKSTDEADERLPDWIELYNPGDTTNISGWIIKDSNDGNVYQIADNTFIEPGGYLVFEYDESGVNGFDFGLGSADSVRLYNRLEELLSETSWEENQVPDGTSWGRIPDGTGDFKVLENITKASANME